MTEEQTIQMAALFAEVLYRYGVARHTVIREFSSDKAASLRALKIRCQTFSDKAQELLGQQFTTVFPFDFCDDEEV